MGKYILVCKEYISLLRLIIYVLYSFTRTLASFYLGLLFTCPVARVNLLSRWRHLMDTKGNWSTSTCYQLAQRRNNPRSQTTVVVCNDLWGKELHRQVGMAHGYSSDVREPTWYNNGSTLARNARDVGLSSALLPLCTVFPIFITLMTVLCGCMPFPWFAFLFGTLFWDFINAKHDGRMDMARKHVSHILKLGKYSCKPKLVLVSSMLLFGLS